MQNKGAITLFAILLTLVSLYQLSFTWITKNVEADAKEYAGGDLKKEKLYLDSISSEVVYNFLFIKGYTFRECKERELNLGLDLKGGMNVTLEVSVIDLINSMANNSKDKTYVEAIKKAKEKQKDSQEDFVTLFGQAFKEVDPNAKLASIFGTLDLKDRIQFSSTNEEVLEVIRKEAQNAIDNSFNILRTRIDRFGVTQPNIQRLGSKTSGRVLVELPGIKDPSRVRKLLQGTAKLEFWETYENSEVYKYLETANSVIKEKDFPEEEMEKDTTVVKKEIAKEDVIKKDKDSTTNELLEEVAKSDSISSDSSAIASREDFAKKFPLFAVLIPNTSREGRLYPGASVGSSRFKDTAKVNEYLKRQEVKELFPRDLKFAWTVKPIFGKNKKPTDFYQLVAIKANMEGKASLDGDVITDARSDFGNNQATAEVTMSMNGRGSQIWARLTKDNVGKQVAIVLDDYVYSFPMVNGEIKGGRSSITGNFSIAEAKDLANVLKSGKLPAPARILEEEIVGPSLGQESIDAGLISFIIAFIVVLLYMVFYYNKAGWVADLALMANIFFIFGILASLGAVLTLPGIAGIVLTLGMSVDANVLIYERIREELDSGKGLKLAISDGYRNAYSAIIDANITTLLTGFVLYTFGTGPIKGFATTLIIGIFTSLFAAIFLTRILFLTFWNEKEDKISFATKLTEGAFKNMNIQFLAKRKTFYTISIVIVAMGIISLAFKGLNYGVDFTGGRTFIVRFDEKVATTDIAKSLAKVYDNHAPEVKIYGQNNQVKITTKFMIESEDKGADKIVETKLFEGLKPYLKGITFDDFIKNHRMSSQKVGPTIADDIIYGAVLAIFFALVIIFLYILFRFRNWQFGVGAVAALTHDVLIVLALFSILYGFLPFSLEIDQAFIAALLTVIGYSINDTVVVFDRIREFLGIYKKEEKGVVYNKALNSTLSRTFSTSLSTFFVLLAIFAFGGASIRGFIFAILIGIVVGTYSSLFIATPVVYDTINKYTKIKATTNDIRERRKMKKKKDK